eukprot:TRINITY_DN21663_c0_g1_i1.p1 TRINITY_DN21663_c0_g1~~TRINITY_DN21663_c0_g1_i1.p1  ORF type:complete len:348 (+),score=76.62 TRINITY_DN21663_c0_g1_i1:26-1069(+)
MGDIEPEEESFPLVCKFGAQVLPVVYTANTTVRQLKEDLFALTNVRPERQKFLGLAKGRIPADSAKLQECNLRPGQRFILMGTPEADIPADITSTKLLEYSVDEEGYEADAQNDQDIASLPENIEALQYRLGEGQREIIIMHAPRPGKRLLVLDIDYTVFDCKSERLDISILKRPHLDQFLGLVYKYYDIAFWSQTSWRWVEAKLTEMGLLLHHDFRVSFILDREHMISVTDRNYYQRKQKEKRKDGEDKKVKKYEVKPLAVIWNKFPQWFHAANTVHVDDLERNFVMNRRNGLRISAYRNAATAYRTDRELLLLGAFLVSVKDCSDFRDLELNAWREQVLALCQQQ